MATSTYSRRHFITSLVTGAAAVSVTSLDTHAAPVVKQESLPSTPLPKSRGYQHTEHVDTYYRLADF